MILTQGDHSEGRCGYGQHGGRWEGISSGGASFKTPISRLKPFPVYAHLLIRPLAVVVGGAKVADKIGVLGSLIPKADLVLVGGRMAFTFLAAEGVSVGATQIESERLKVRPQ